MAEEDTSIYEDGRHYDEYNHFEEDVPFYRGCIEEYGGPVLELACGTGRVAVPLAEAGSDMTGLDLSQNRLELARQKASEKGLDVDFVRGDMRTFTLDRKFGTIILPANSIESLIELYDYEKLFSRVDEHLKEDGRFVFQIFNPDLDILSRDPDEEFDVVEYDDPYEEKKIQITEKLRYRSADQVLDLDWFFRKDDKLLEKWDWQLRILFPKEIDALLRHNGFEVEEKYGEFDRSEFTDDSRTQILVCKKRG